MAEKTMKIKAPVLEEVPLSKLKPWDRNPRVDHAVEKLKKSIEEFGYISPIIAQKGTYRIIAGHGRYETLQSMGVEKVAVIVVDMDDQKAALYTVADNKLGEFSDWDMRELGRLMKKWDADNLNLELTGFGPDELHRMLSKVAEPPAFAPTGPSGSSGNVSVNDEGSDMIPPAVSQGSPNTPTLSPVRSIQLYFSGDEYSEFMGMLETVALKCDTKNATDTCFEALKRENADVSR